MAYQNYDFNSIKVRLELYDVEQSSYFDEEFQFHKGTIRTSISITTCRTLTTISIP